MGESLKSFRLPSLPHVILLDSLKMSNLIPIGDVMSDTTQGFLLVDNPFQIGDFIKQLQSQGFIILNCLSAVCINPPVNLKKTTDPQSSWFPIIRY